MQEPWEEEDDVDPGELQARMVPGRSVSYPGALGATWANSLSFGLVGEPRHQSLDEAPSKVMYPRRRFISDLTEWEESVPFVDVVNETDWEVQAPPLASPTKPCIKPFQLSDIRYNVATYNPDPDVTDCNRLRVPNLNTKLRRGTSRTASPPPRPDDPNKIWAEYERRRRGLRFHGPPLPRMGVPKSKSFVRSRQWEMMLPDEEFGVQTTGRKKSTTVNHGLTPGPSRPRSPSRRKYRHQARKCQFEWEKTPASLVDPTSLFGGGGGVAAGVG